MSRKPDEVPTRALDRGTIKRVELTDMRSSILLRVAVVIVALLIVSAVGVVA